MSNLEEERKNRTLEEFEENLFRLAMYKVAQKEGALLERENRLLKEELGPPPEETFRRFQERLEREIFNTNDKPKATMDEDLGKSQKQLGTEGSGQKNKKLSSHNFFMKQIGKAAAVFLAAAGILSVCFVLSFDHVEAFRDGVLKFVITRFDDHTEFGFETEKGYFEAEDVADLMRLEPTYIPEGYYLEEYEDHPGMSWLLYLNAEDEDKWIDFGEYCATTTIAVDSEDAQVVEEIDIQGETGLYIEKNGYVTITWKMHRSIFMISASGLDGEEVRKMAESLDYPDDTPRALSIRERAERDDFYYAVLTDLYYLLWTGPLPEGSIENFQETFALSEEDLNLLKEMSQAHFQESRLLRSRFEERERELMETYDATLRELMENGVLIEDKVHQQLLAQYEEGDVDYVNAVADIVDRDEFVRFARSFRLSINEFNSREEI